QLKRSDIVSRFKAGTLPVLVASDVASRGLHIDGVTHVINYDLPQDKEDYVHRIGRTARAGAEGSAISFACEEYVYALEDIEKYIKEKIPVVQVEDHLVVKDYKQPAAYHPVKKHFRAASDTSRKKSPGERFQGNKREHSGRSKRSPK